MDMMLQLQNPSSLQQSFNEFAKQPCNAELVEQAVNEDLLASLDVQEAAHMEEIMHADDDTRRALEPFLRHRPLVRLLHCLSKDAAMAISEWAANPRVIHMLRSARRLLQSSAMTEQELEELLLAYIKHPTNPHRTEFERQTSARMAVTAPEHLAAALNEQLEERQLGNRAYESGAPATALHHYTRGLAVLKLLQPQDPGDQELVREAQRALLLNSAAAHIAVGGYSACVAACSTVLEQQPDNLTAQLRRARAHMMRRDYQAAAADLDAAEALAGGSHQGGHLADLRAQLRGLQQRDRRSDKRLYARMLGAGGA